MDREELRLLTKSIIDKFSVDILNELGFDKKPDNLIIVPSEKEETALGLCLAFFTNTQQLTYCNIYLYSHNIVWFRKDGFYNMIGLSKLTRKLLERRILYVLAHELRHFWQYSMGYYKEPSMLLTSINRRLHPMEIDADKWAKKYLIKSIKENKIEKL